MSRLAVSVIAGVAVLLVGMWAPERAPAAKDDCLAVETFARTRVGEFPSEWKLRKDEGRSVYSVREERGMRFLRAEAKGLGIQAAREVDGWDLRTHPVLAWSWRPRQFPEGGDEREADTNDSVLAVYMFVPHSKVAGPKALKYVWSEKVEPGTWLTSNRGLTQVRVLRRGGAGKGEWREERVNVLDDWKKAFESSATPTPAGIGVLTDSDDTKSTAAGDYANFRICRA